MPKRTKYIYTNMKTRLSIILIALLLPSFLGISFMNYRSACNNILDSLVTVTMPLVRDSLYNKLKLDLRDPVVLSSLMANDTFLKNWVQDGEKDITEIENYLNEIKNKYNFSSAFFVSNISANYYTPKGKLKTISQTDTHDVWYYDFINSNKEYDLDVDTDQAHNDHLTIFINNRVILNGKLLGVTGVGISVNDISKYLSKLQNQYGNTVYLIDETGTIQAHPDINIIENKKIQDIPGIKNHVRELLNENQNPFDLTYIGGKGEVFVTVQYISDLNWHIVVEQNKQEVLHEARHTLTWNIVFTVIISLIVIFISIVVVNFFQVKLEELSQTDKLTGLFNRRHIDTLLDREIKRAERYNRKLSVIIIDIDYFKNVNDTFGHLKGDIILNKFATILKNRIRTIDIVGRWGGEEFFIIAPETNSESAMLFTEVLREKIASADFSPVKTVTASYGIAEYYPGDDIDSLVKKADQALYHAKNSGRDKAVFIPQSSK